MSTPTTSQPAGWYPDPQTPTQARYWDGQQWTGQTQPIGMVAQGGSNSPAQGALGGPGLKEGLTHEQREARERAQSRGKVLVPLLGISATIMTIDAVMGFMVGGQISTLNGPEVRQAMDSGLLDGAVRTAIYVPLALTMVVWMMWQFATVKTLGMKVAKGAAWHAWAWLMPFVGVILGVVNMFRIRKATSGGVALWSGWAACLVTPMIVGVWVHFSLGTLHMKSLTSQTPVLGSDVAPLLILQAGGSLMLAVAGLCALLMVRKTTAALFPQS